MHLFSCSRDRSLRWPQSASGTLLCVLLTLVIICIPLQVRADSTRVLILTGDTGGAYDEVTAALQRRVQEVLPGAIDLDIQNIAQANGAFDPLLSPRPRLIITIGTRASALAMHNSGDIPVLSLLVPTRDYAALDRNHFTGENLRSAIYLDQPLERQLDLLQLALPDTRRLASLSGPQSAEQVDELQTLSQQRGLQLAVETVTGGSNPIHPLTRLTDRAEVLLALPDPDVFNRNSVQAILLTTYRNRIPIIGFSRAYVRAGALAAVYSSAEQIGIQAGEWLAELARTGRWQLGQPRYPMYYSVAVNAQVAQSLGIVIADEQELLAQLKELEQRRP